MRRSSPPRPEDRGSSASASPGRYRSARFAQATAASRRVACPSSAASVWRGPREAPAFALIAVVRFVGKRLAPDRVVGEHAPLVVAKSRLVVGEEHLAHERAAAADTGLLEDLLQVLLDCVRGDDEPLGDLGGRVASKDQPGDLLLALG